MMPENYQIQTNFVKALSVVHMSKQELKETFWDKIDHDIADGKLSWGGYLTGVKKYLKQVVRSGGSCLPPGVLYRTHRTRPAV